MVPPRAKKQQSMVIRNNSSSSLSAVKPRILLVCTFLCTPSDPHFSQQEQF